MVQRELAEDAVALRRERDGHAAAVVLRPVAVGQASRDEAVDELDGAVVAELHTVGKCGDIGPFAGADGEHELVLLGLDACRSRCVLAEAEEAADGEAEIVEGAVVGVREVVHGDIISCHDIYALASRSPCRRDGAVSARMAKARWGAYPCAMERVRIAAAAVAHPSNVVTQDEAARSIGALGSERRVRAMGRATRIETRRTLLPPAELACLGTIEERNNLYLDAAGPLARSAVGRALDGADPATVGCLVTTSCTGYSVPGWGSELVESLPLRCDVARLPITEAGCAGGVVALARAADYVRSHPGQAAAVAAVELCSLAFHVGGGEGNLTSSLIFGDGAGAVLLQPGAGDGLEILDSMSVLVPGTRDALGFDLTDRGFYPVLTRELTTLLPAPTAAAAARLLSRNGFAPGDVTAWLLHPGGARILSGLERCMALTPGSTRWSWESMREFGNTSSAAIFDVIRRYLDEGPRGLAVIAAFGPGVSIELLLVRAAC